MLSGFNVQEYHVTGITSALDIELQELCNVCIYAMIPPAFRFKNELFHALNF